MVINFNVKEPYKNLILSGIKTIEGRLYKGKFAQLQIWDVLQFEDTQEELEVIKLTVYPSFKMMLENEGLKYVLPWIKSIEEWIRIYHQFYTPAQEEEFWVIAIEIGQKE